MIYKATGISVDKLWDFPLKEIAELLNTSFDFGTRFLGWTTGEK